MKQKRGDKRAVSQMPYNMIFSIFLIVVFFIVAFIAIRHFLSISDIVETATFIDDLQYEIDVLWRSTGAEETTFISRVPSKIERVCFTDSEGHNLYFEPMQDVDPPRATINHVNLTALNIDPYCIENQGDRISIILEKRFYEPLVRISRM